ncbi:TPA: hypothetical protein ACH3X2_012894 [Trebouxia sp. C0005]
MSYGLTDKHVQGSESLVSSLSDTSLQAVCSSNIVVISCKRNLSWQQGWAMKHCPNASFCVSGTLAFAGPGAVGGVMMAKQCHVKSHLVHTAIVHGQISLA